MAAPRPSDPSDMRAEQQARLFEPPPNLGKEGRSSHDVDESVVAGQGQGHHWSEGDPTASNHRALDDARATVDVLHGIFERLGTFGVSTLGELTSFKRKREKKPLD